MGSGNWTSMAYNTTIKNMGFSDTRSITSASVQTSFSAKCINPQLNPLHVCRECIDTTEHPNTIPINKKPENHINISRRSGFFFK